MYVLQLLEFISQQRNVSALSPIENSDEANPTYNTDGTLKVEEWLPNCH